jgi:hypothetical protein
VKRKDQFVELEAGKTILKCILNTNCEMGYEIHPYQAGPVGSFKPESSII